MASAGYIDRPARARALASMDRSPARSGRTCSHASTQNRHARGCHVSETRANATRISEIVSSMYTLFDSVIARLRKRTKTPTGFVSIALLVQVFGLRIQAVDFGRSSLHGKVIRICRNAPRETQAYQIARACCAYALVKMKLIRYVSPHDLCVALCGVSAGDDQVTLFVEPTPTEVQLAEVHELFAGKRRR